MLRRAVVFVALFYCSQLLMCLLWALSALCLELSLKVLDFVVFVALA